MSKLTSYARKIYKGVFPDTLRERLWHMRGRTSREARAFRGALNVRCHVCLSKNVLRYKNPSVEHLTFAFFICQDCGFIFVHPTPDLSAVYTESQVPPLGEGEHLWNTHFLESIERHTESKDKLLEIGFGNASFLRLASASGWDVHGLELSPRNVEHARDELKLPNIQHSTVEDAHFPDDHFGVVAAFNFIEHVPDPRATLRELRRILRPGGLLVLLCPNMAGLYHQLVPEVFGKKDPLDLSWVPPQHLSYFNKGNFKRLLTEAGFEVVADESPGTRPLWLQHKAFIGPEVTGQKLSRLLSEIESSEKPEGAARVKEYKGRITELLLQRLCWALVTDVMELEAALGAESTILYLGRKTAANGRER